MAKANEHTKLVERHQQTPGPALKAETCPLLHDKGEWHLPLWEGLRLGPQGARPPLPAAAALSETSGIRDLSASLAMPRAAGADGGHLRLRLARPQPRPWDPFGHLRAPLVLRGEAMGGPREQRQPDAITFRHPNH